MEVKISYHQVDSSNEVNEFVQKCSNKIKEHGHDKLRINWTIGSENKKFKVEAHVKDSDYLKHFHTSGEGIYSEIDKLSEKIIRSFRKHKNIKLAKNHRVQNV